MTKAGFAVAHRILTCIFLFRLLPLLANLYRFISLEYEDCT